MSLIQTQIFGLMNPSSRILARNAHLIPEIHTRAKRILQSAKEEMIMANSVVRTMCEYWSKYRSGKKCTCRQDVDEYNEIQSERKGMPDLAEFIRSGNLRILNEKEFCPICYGTGIEGGYNLLGTCSLMLTANNVTHISDGISIKQGIPYTINVGKSGKITWEIDLPKYFLNTHTIVLYWNKEPENYNLYLDNKEFNLDIFNSLGQVKKNNDKTKITLEIDDASGTVELYYLRIILKTNRNTLVSVDVPNYTYSYSGELQAHNERQTTITANFDATIGKAEITDIFFMCDDQVGWRITENEFINPLDVVISNNCQCRLIRSWENYYLLPSKYAHKQYPMPNFTFVY